MDNWSKLDTIWICPIAGPCSWVKLRDEQGPIFAGLAVAILAVIVVGLLVGQLKLGRRR